MSPWVSNCCHFLVNPRQSFPRKAANPSSICSRPPLSKSQLQYSKLRTLSLSYSRPYYLSWSTGIDFLVRKVCPFLVQKKMFQLVLANKASKHSYFQIDWVQIKIELMVWESMQSLLNVIQVFAVDLKEAFVFVYLSIFS